MKSTLPNELAPTERAAFETLVRLVGFTPQVRFGRATEHLALSVEGRVLYAIYPVQNGGAVLRRGAREFRLLIVPAGDAREARAERKAPRAKLHRGTPEYVARMREIGRETWRRRVRKYGPTGLKPGTPPPWTKPNNIAFQKHQAKLEREQAAEPPEKPLKTF